MNFPPDMPNPYGLPPVQARMMYILSDGKAHHEKELHGCLMDTLGPIENIHNHISEIRRVIRILGESIGCVRERDGAYYFHARLVKVTE